MIKRILFMWMITSVFVISGCSEKENVEPPTFTVSFDSQGGTDVASQTVEDGKKATKPASPTKQNAVFVDWYKEAACTNVWDFNKEIVKKNTTLYAKWADKQFTVSFDTNGGSRIDPQAVADGGKIMRPAPPTKEGYAFENWYKESTFVHVYDFSEPITGDITIYAKWTVVNRESLLVLIEESNTLNPNRYTSESYSNMIAKRTAAEEVAYSESAQTQILKAYTELSEAISALEELPYVPTVDIYFDPQPIGDFVYVNPGAHFYMYAQGVSSDDYDPSTNNGVTFDLSQLMSWILVDEVSNEPMLDISNNNVSCQLSSSLIPGTTVVIAIKSAEFPDISKTVTIKVAGQGELKGMFLIAVNALPAKDQVSYDDYDAIENAYSLYWRIPQGEREEAEIRAAYEKVLEYQHAYWELPFRIFYTFDGNTCIFTTKDGKDEYTERCTFTSNGTFPAGTYTLDWYDDKGYGYFQDRIVLKADRTIISEQRQASDIKGTNATAWKQEDTGTYTFTGNRADGGILYITWDDEDVSSKANGRSVSSFRSKTGVKFSSGK